MQVMPVYNLILYVFILALQHNKYYIGLTDRPDIDVPEYFCGNANVWTQMHKPERIINITRVDNPFLVDGYTKQYMAQYGLENVRGGSYDSYILTDMERVHLGREFKYYRDLVKEMEQYEINKLSKEICLKKIENMIY